MLFLFPQYPRFDIVITNNGHALLSDIVVSDPSAISGAPTYCSFLCRLFINIVDCPNKLY